MFISEIMSFQSYWDDPRFRGKKPHPAGSLKQLYGDNIYHHDQTGGWVQADSHHSDMQGQSNTANLEHDTSVDRVLIAERFSYWGAAAPCLPVHLRGSSGICKVGPGHRSRFNQSTISAFLDWVCVVVEEDGGVILGDPAEFANAARIRQLRLFGRQTSQ